MSAIPGDALRALRALSDAATEGPWRVGDGAISDGVFAEDAVTAGEDEEGLVSHLVAWCHSEWRNEADAAFIVAAVNFVRASLVAQEAPGTRASD